MLPLTAQAPEVTPARRTAAGIKPSPKALVRASGIRAAAPVAAGDHDHGVAMVRVMTDLETIGGIAGNQAETRRRRSWVSATNTAGAPAVGLAAAFGEDLNQQVADAAHPVVAAMGVGLALAIVTTALLCAARSGSIRRRAARRGSSSSRCCCLASSDCLELDVISNLYLNHRENVAV